MKINIFYSWQSDKPKDINLNLIQDAAMVAIKRIGTDDNIEVIPLLDRDTQNEPGSPAIAEAIFSKIKNCSIFLCDATIVTQSDQKRMTPNPNVMIELGYAVACIGWERIICVMNECYGGPSKLPFDLKHRRWPIRYRLSDTANEAQVDEAKESLSQNIELAIRTIIQSGVIGSSVNTKDRRVALKFNGALSGFIGNLAGFLIAHGFKDGMKIILQDFPDESGSKYPALNIVDPILNILSKNTLNELSKTSIGGRQLPWSLVFINELERVCQECNRILDQYADRDDTLISLVDEINSRAGNLAFMISAVNTPQLASLYEKGIPDDHIDHFRYFLLTALKAYRTIRQFDVKVQ